MTNSDTMKKLTGIIWTLVLLCSLSLTAGSAVAGEVYKLSMLPRYYPEKITAMITPLATYLSAETGLSIVPVLTDNFADYEKQVINNTIAIGYENPVVYENVSTAHEVIATAIKGQGGDRFRGIIITRPDSPIRSLEDLRQKSIMIVGKNSAGGYFSQAMTLMDKGIVVNRDCTLSVAADNKQENVIIAVSVGDVDAGFIRESALHKADKYIQPGSIKVLTQTAWLPNWAFSLQRTMPQEDKNRIMSALLSLKKESEVLQAMELNGFKRASDFDYEKLAQTIRELQ